MHDTQKTESYVYSIFYFENWINYSELKIFLLWQNGSKFCKNTHEKYFTSTCQVWFKVLYHMWNVWQQDMMGNWTVPTYDNYLFFFSFFFFLMMHYIYLLIISKNKDNFHKKKGQVVLLMSMTTSKSYMPPGCAKWVTILGYDNPMF